MMSTIKTRAGHYFDFLNPDPAMVRIEDIAAGLSKTCRFHGQTEGFYSVAQHSFLASYIVPEEDAFAALMHDAAEAYTGDIAKPLKELLPDFKVIERRVEAAVFSAFGIPEKLPPSVKHADLILLATEQRDLMGAASHRWTYTEGIQPLERRILPWPHELAHDCFMTRFRQLCQKRGAA